MDGPRLDYRHRILPKSAEYLNVTCSTRFITLPCILQPKCFILGFYIYTSDEIGRKNIRLNSKA